MKTIKLFLLIVLPGYLFAQADSTNVQIATIKWTVEEFLDIAKNQYVSHASYFVSHGNDSIQWFQNGGSHQSTFLVNSVEGSWNNVTIPGSIMYHASLRGINGNLSFNRDGDQVTIKMEFEGVRGGGFNYLFTVSSFEIQ